MFGNFSEEARKALSLAKKEMIELKHPFVGSEHLLLGILSIKSNYSFLLQLPSPLPLILTSPLPILLASSSLFSSIISFLLFFTIIG